MNTDRSVIIGKYFLYENALNSKAYIFNEFVSLVRDKIRVEKYTFHVRLAVKRNLKQNGLPCPIATNFSPVIDYKLKFVKMQFLVKSISL